MEDTGNKARDHALTSITTVGTIAMVISSARSSDCFDSVRSTGLNENILQHWAWDKESDGSNTENLKIKF